MFQQTHRHQIISQSKTKISPTIMRVTAGVLNKFNTYNTIVLRQLYCTDIHTGTRVLCNEH